MTPQLAPVLGIQSQEGRSLQEDQRRATRDVQNEGGRVTCRISPFFPNHLPRLCVQTNGRARASATVHVDLSPCNQWRTRETPLRLASGEVLKEVAFPPEGAGGGVQTMHVPLVAEHVQRVPGESGGRTRSPLEKVRIQGNRMVKLPELRSPGGV